MHSTRIATFLLGAWMACCVFMDGVAIQNLRLTSRFLSAPIAPAEAIVNSAGAEQAALLLRHFAAEQNRYFYSNWELIQIPIALVLALVVFIAAEKRIFGPLIVGMMLVLVLFQAFAITPEMGFRGRFVDFPPGSQSIGAQARVWALTQVFIGVEAAKLLLGGVATGYLFTYKSRRRSRLNAALAEEGDALRRGAG